MSVLVKKMRGQMAAEPQAFWPVPVSQASGCAPAAGHALAYTSIAAFTGLPLGSNTSKYIADGAASVNLKNTSGPLALHNPGSSSAAVAKLKGKSPPAEMSVALAQRSLGVLQSVSLKSVQPDGQQPSPSMHCVCCPDATHCAVHVPAL